MAYRNITLDKLKSEITSLVEAYKTANGDAVPNITKFEFVNGSIQQDGGLELSTDGQSLQTNGLNVTGALTDAAVSPFPTTITSLSFETASMNPGTSGLNFDGVTNLAGVFARLSNLAELNLEGLNTSNNTTVAPIDQLLADVPEDCSIKYSSFFLVKDEASGAPTYKTALEAKTATYKKVINSRSVITYSNTDTSKTDALYKGGGSITSAIAFSPLIASDTIEEFLTSLGNDQTGGNLSLTTDLLESTVSITADNSDIVQSTLTLNNIAFTKDSIKSPDNSRTSKSTLNGISESADFFLQTPEVNIIYKSESGLSISLTESSLTKKILTTTKKSTSVPVTFNGFKNTPVITEVRVDDAKLLAENANNTSINVSFVDESSNNSVTKEVLTFTIVSSGEEFTASIPASILFVKELTFTTPTSAVIDTSVGTSICDVTTTLENPDLTGFDGSYTLEASCSGPENTAPVVTRDGAKFTIAKSEIEKSGEHTITVTFVPTDDTGGVTASLKFDSEELVVLDTNKDNNQYSEDGTKVPEAAKFILSFRW